MSAASSASSSVTSTVSSCSAKFTSVTRSRSASPVTSRSRVMPSFLPVSPWPGRILSSGLRSSVGFVSWITPRKFAPVEPWRTTGRAPPTRSTEHESSRVSLRYRPSPRESEWMSPNWSVNRNMLPCFKTWTLPRSVAFSMGSSRGSKKRTLVPASGADTALAGGAASGAGCAMRSWVSRAIVGSAQVRQPIGLIGHDERVDQLVEIALQDPGQVVDGQPDAVVCDPVLRVVVGPDLLRAVAAANHGLARRRVRLPLLGQLQVVKPGPQHAQGLGLVLVLALLVLDLDDEAARQVRDSHRGIRCVHALAARPGRTLDLDPEVLLLVDLDLDVVRLRHDDDRGGRG